MTFQRHVFGSYRGYCTLGKSPGVSQDDCRFIESCVYGFGQTYDPTFYASLADEPTFMMLPLNDGSRGFSRAFSGPRDDKGRPTIRFITAILTQYDWDAVLMGDMAQLTRLPALWDWDGQADLPALDLPNPVPRTRLSRGRVREVLSLISALERSWADGARLVVSAADFVPEDFRAVEMLLPPPVRPRFSSAYRVLSAGMPTSLVALAEEVEQSAMTYRPGSDGAGYSPYALALDDAGIASGVLPLARVIGYANFGVLPGRSREQALVRKPSVVVATAPCPPQPRRRPTWLWPAIAAGVLGLALGFAAGWLLSTHYSDNVRLPSSIQLQH